LRSAPRRTVAPSHEECSSASSQCRPLSSQSPCKRFGAFVSHRLPRPTAKPAIDPERTAWRRRLAASRIGKRRSTRRQHHLRRRRTRLAALRFPRTAMEKGPRRGVLLACGAQRAFGKGDPLSYGVHAPKLRPRAASPRTQVQKLVKIVAGRFAHGGDGGMLGIAHRAVPEVADDTPPCLTRAPATLSTSASDAGKRVLSGFSAASYSGKHKGSGGAR
jgi:hypothetical protein